MTIRWKTPILPIDAVDADDVNSGDDESVLYIDYTDNNQDIEKSSVEIRSNLKNCIQHLHELIIIFKKIRSNL